MKINVLIIAARSDGLTTMEETVYEETKPPLRRALREVEKQTIAHYSAGVEAGDLVSFSVVGAISSDNGRIAYFPNEVQS